MKNLWKWTGVCGMPKKDNQDVEVKQGSRLKISYVENAGQNVATKIEIIEV